MDKEYKSKAKVNRKVKVKTRGGKNMGGCLVGKKEKTTGGGCKVGRKGVNFKVRNPGNPIIISKKKKAKPKSAGAIEAARIKAKVARKKKIAEMKPKKKVGARVINKKPSSGIAKIPPKKRKKRKLSVGSIMPNLIK